MLQLAPHIQAGQRLKGAMRARGWTLADLAKATGLSVRTCCTLQQGQGNVANYTRCCIALGVPTGLTDGNSSGRHLRLATWDDYEFTRQMVRQSYGIDVPPPQRSPVQVKLRHAPCELKEANAIVAAWHRHHQRVAGHRFSIKCIDENSELRGVGIVGRPVARMTCQRTVVEITRMVSDGTANVCSFLYAACTHAARRIGYRQIQTFLLESEPATTLKALKDLGWKFAGWSGGGVGWQSRRGRRDDQPTCRKQRWVCILQSDAKSV